MTPSEQSYIEFGSREHLRWLRENARPGPRFCPGSVYTPTKDGLCLCGYSRESHALEHDGHGGFLPIEQDRRS